MNQPSKKPNIVIIYADDLGFGDISCYGGNINTPHIDALASGGRVFTNGYATAATCTPSRYSLLTGSYPWRNPQAAILAGDAPMIIDNEEPTLPAMLKKQGYTTGIVGKWHLGLGSAEKLIDWNGPMAGTPNDIGFDESFIMAATNDRVPCVYVKNRQVANLDPKDPIEVIYGAKQNPFPKTPTGKENPEQLTMKHSHGHDGTIINGVGRIGFMQGGTSALWNDETMGETFLRQAQSFVQNHKDEPLFLYYALHQPHVPRIPNPRFAGTTGLGPRGDVIAELDWCVGEFIQTLRTEGLLENTLVIFSSDNGPVLDDGYQDQAVTLCGSHTPAGPLRGGKYSLFDGGTRVPFLASWPGTIVPNSSKSIVCHVDFFASLAHLVGHQLVECEAPDSENVLAALLGVAEGVATGTTTGNAVDTTTDNAVAGTQEQAGRTELVTEGTQGNTLFRQGDWIYIPPHIGPKVYKQTNTESGNALCAQLYHCTSDIGQQHNVAKSNKKRVQAMKQRLKEIHASDGTRST